MPYKPDVALKRKLKQLRKANMTVRAVQQTPDADKNEQVAQLETNELSAVNLSNADEVATNDSQTVMQSDNSSGKRTDKSRRKKLLARAEKKKQRSETGDGQSDAERDAGDEDSTSRHSNTDVHEEKVDEEASLESEEQSSSTAKNVICPSMKIMSNQNFDSLEGVVSKGTLKAIEAMGFTTMTQVQAKCIPPLLEGRDLMGTAKTGSGKTLAFLIPAIELLFKLRFLQRNGTGCIVISPTRELSMQTYGVLNELLANHHLSHGLVIGGANRNAEAKKLAEGVCVLVATPGRLLDHLQSTPDFEYKNLQCLIIDEADRILDIGFETDMRKIVQLLPKKRQTVMFSATQNKKIEDLQQLALKKEPIFVNISEDSDQATVEGLRQGYVVCPPEKRFHLLYTFLRKNMKKKVLVFFSSCASVKFHNELLNYINVPTTCIHGKQKQQKRTTTFFSFCKAENGILLCTDVAARGLDIPRIDWIIQYDPPDDPKDYIHRVGRTARGEGAQGNALLILQPLELKFLYYLKQAKIPVAEYELSWSKVADIQNNMERLISQNFYLHRSAKDAFKAYVRAYDSHHLRHIFDVQQLDIAAVAKSFGFQTPPYVDIGVGSIKARTKRRSSDYPNANDSKKRKAVIYKPLKQFKNDARQFSS